MKPAIRLLSICLLMIAAAARPLRAQTSVPAPQIAVFLPLYLDSAFDAAGQYRLGDQFPRYLNPGIEFYEGLQLAMDSLDRTDLAADITVYDTRSATGNVQQILKGNALDSVKLIIGYTDGPELRLLAAAAAARSIPFVNVNYPNSAGVTNNPELVLLNSTLHSHFEGMYKFIQRNWATSNLLYVRSKSPQDERVKTEFADIEKNMAVPLHLKTVVLDNTSDSSALLPYLDSSAKNIVLIGTLNNDFARLVCSRLVSLSALYKYKVVGMPTWDGVDVASPDFRDLELYYSTPFYTRPTDTVALGIQRFYQSRFYTRPSDWVYRGYDVTLRFAQLLAAHQGNLSGSIGEKRFTVFDDFDIQPVFLNRQVPTLDYLENRKLYFIKKVNGSIVAVY